MNRIYLFGQVLSKSNLKYCIKPKLRIYMQLVIRTCNGNEFNCIVGEELLDGVIDIKGLGYVYVIGYGVIQNDLLTVVATEIYKF